MKKITSVILLLITAMLLSGCNQTHARFAESHDDVTFTLKNKKLNPLGSSEDHTQWMLVSEEGDKYLPYHGFVEIDVLGRSKLYKKLEEGQKYHCVVHDIISFPPAKYPVVKDCKKV